MFDPYEQVDLNDGCAPPHLNKRIGGKYLIQKQVGSGSSARVYSAKVYPGSDLVAIKILREHASTRLGERRLALEGKALLAISKHKNFVSVHDFGKTEAGEPYLVLDLVENAVTLKQILKDYKVLNTDKALDIGLQLIEALRHMHSLGFIHATFKPSDILLIDYFNQKTPDIKLIDLDSALHPDEPDLQCTNTLGEGATFHYMSPELAQGLKVDSRTDIYNFGLVMYEMLTGRQPFDGLNTVEVFNNRLASNIVPFKQAKPEIAHLNEIEEVLRCCLQCNMNKRIQSMAELNHIVSNLRKGTADTMEFAVDLKNWDKLPRSAYGEPEEDVEDIQSQTWFGELKKLMGR